MHVYVPVWVSSYGEEQLGNPSCIAPSRCILAGFSLRCKYIAPHSAPCPPAQFPNVLALPKSSDHLLTVELWQGWWHGDTEHVLV